MVLENNIGLDTECLPPKRDKGASIISLPNEYVLIDIETTGLTQYDNIIEIAFIKIKNDKEVDRVQTLIKPPEFDVYLEDLIKDEIATLTAAGFPILTEDGEKYFSCYVDGFIEDLTGITNAMLKDAPEFNKVASTLYEFLGKNIIVGYNVNFDINFLYDNFEATLGKKMQNNFIDILRIARKLLPELPNHKLTTVAKYFNVSGASHRALNDCLITDAVYQKLKEILTTHNIDLTELFKKKADNLSILTTDGSEFDEEHIFYQKNCVFTGKLDKMPRKQAAQLVVNIGGLAQNSVNKETNFLILGNLDYLKSVKEGKSAKMKKAEKLILSGQELQIISEDIFYDFIFAK